MAFHQGRILYEDEHLLIVTKLPHELVVGGDEREGKGKLPLNDFLRKDYPGIRVVHRLDFGTSGVLVFARTKEAAEKIRESKFAGWEKRYRALVAGRVELKVGEIRKMLPARSNDDLVPALTRYRVLRLFPAASYVEAMIDTGRKHQIRRHFAAIHHPLLLDPLYGDKKADRTFTKRYGYRRFFLHASSLTLPHPMTGEKLHVGAPLPAVFAQALERLSQR